MAIQDSPINRLPAGLLGALDIKAMGKNPERLASVVNGVIDLTAFYTEHNMTRVRDNATVNLPATPVSAIKVPAGKMWIVKQVTAFGTALGAGAAISAALYITDPQLSPVVIGERQNYTVGEMPFFKLDRPAPFLMYPGFQVAFWVVGAALTTGLLEVNVQRLEIDI